MSRRCQTRRSWASGAALGATSIAALGAVLGVVLTGLSLGCRAPAAEPAAPPPIRSASLSPSAAASPGEIALGHLLVELRPGVALREFGPIAASPAAVKGAAALPIRLPDEAGEVYR